MDRINNCSLFGGWSRRVTFGLYLLATTIVGCQPKPPQAHKHDSIKIIQISETALDTAVRLDIRGSSVRHIRLETKQNCLVQDISQVKIVNDLIYLLDKTQSALFIFKLTGKFLKKISFNEKLVSFDLYSNSIYVLVKIEGKVYELDLNGKLIQVIRLGFHGVQFVVSAKNSFVFNTAGLKTDDNGSMTNQLSLVNLTGNGENILPFPPLLFNASYYFNNQLIKQKNTVYFASAFENKIYRLSGKNAVPIIQLNFGRFSVPDSMLDKRNDAGAFYDSKYISDVALRALTDDYMFFTFTHKYKEGYILLKRNGLKLLAAGVGLQVNRNSGLIPFGSYKNGFFSVEESATVSEQANYNSPMVSANIKTAKSFANPVIFFYELD
jgi:hypothetical protein